MNKKGKISGVLDRVEGALAIIYTDSDERVEISRSALPKEVKEGDILEIKVSVKKNKTREARNKVKKMIEELNND